MRDTQRRNYEMLARVRDFGATEAASFASTSKGGELFAALRATVGELDGHAEAQTSSRSAAAQGTTGKAAARAALREQLEAISRTARAMAFNNPGLEDRFRLPRGNNDQTLLSAARAFHTDATPLKAEFIRHELPADFLEKLGAAIRDFEQASTGQHGSRTARVAATTAIEAAIERGLALVRQLDAIVRNKFRQDPAKLAAWESASHVERPPRASKKRKAATTKTPPQ